MEYFGYGFGFVGLTLFMMQQIAPGKHQMSHYAFASGIMNLGVMLPGMVSGYLSDLLGYRNFFIYVLIATIPAFLITFIFVSLPLEGIVIVITVLVFSGLAKAIVVDVVLVDVVFP